MLLVMNERLSELVQHIAQEHPQGLRHAEFVKLVLDSGYVHEDDLPISPTIYRMLQELVVDGVLYKPESADRSQRGFCPTKITAA